MILCRPRSLAMARFFRCLVREIEAKMWWVVSKFCVKLPANLNISVNLTAIGTNYTPVDSSLRAESIAIFSFALPLTVWREIQKKTIFRRGVPIHKKNSLKL